MILHKMSSTNSIQQDSLRDLYAPIAEKRSRWSVFKIGSQIVGSVATGAVSAVGRVFFSSYPSVRTLSPMGIGASAFSFADAACPRKYKRVVDQIGIEAIRLGYPLYFMLTQLYLNATNPQDAEFYLDAMLVLYGTQLAAIVRKLAQYHLKARVYRELTPQREKKTLKLLLEDHPADKIKYVTMGILGAGAFGAAYVSAAAQNADALKSLGAFYLGEAVSQPIWKKIETLIGNAEWRFENKLLSEPEFGNETPAHLKAMRALRRLLQIGLPLSVGVLFYKPTPARMGTAGVLHAIMDEMKRYAFMAKEIDKIKSIRFIKFSKVGRWIDTSWKVLRYLSKVGGLSYFSYLIFSSGDKVYDFAFGSFLAGLAIGFAGTLLANYKFDAGKSSPLVTTLYFRTMESSEILGMYPLYVYFYTVRAGIKIGNDALNELTVKTGTLSFVTWGAYGYTLGQAMAQMDFFERYGPQPIRLPDWLLLTNTLLVLDMWNGNVR